MEEPAWKASTPTSVSAQLVSLVPTVSSNQHLAHQTLASMVSVMILAPHTHVPVMLDLLVQTVNQQILAYPTHALMASAQFPVLHLFANVIQDGGELTVL